MADDDSINKISLQDKVKLLDGIKKIKEAEIKEKGEKLSREIDELEEKRKKEMKALDEELKKQSTELDEEMFKAMDALFFRDRRTFLMNKARVDRKQEIIDDSSDPSVLKGESFLYDISEKIFAGQNLKLQESLFFEAYSGKNERKEEDRGYLSNNSVSAADSYRRSEEHNYESNVQGYPEPNPNNYSSRSKSWMDQFESSWGSRRDF